MAETDAFGDEVNVRPDDMRTFANALKRIAERYETLAKAMEADKIPGVRVKNLRTGVMALAGLGKFLGAADTACCNNVSSQAVEPLEAGGFLLAKYIKRTTDSLEKGKPQPNINEQAGAEAAIAAAEHKPTRRDKRRDNVPRKR